MVEKLLQVLGGWVVRYPRGIIALYILLAAGSVLGSITLLGLKADTVDLVGSEQDFNKDYLRFIENFADLEFVYVVIHVENDPERAIQTTEAVTSELELLKADGHVQLVFHRVPFESLGYGLLFQDEKSLRELVGFLKKHRQQLADFAEADRFERLLRVFAESLSAEKLADAGQVEGDANEKLTEYGFRFLSTTVSSLEGLLRGEQQVRLEGLLEQEFDLSLRERGYLATKDDKFLLIEVLPAKDTTTVGLIGEPLLAIRAALDRVRDRLPGIQMGLTGRPVLQADEMATTDRDMRHITIIAVLSVFLLFVLFFRRLTRPFLAVVTLMVSISLTFGLVSVTLGYLTLFSIIFAAMLVGLGIDFGIHFVSRYQEELSRGEGLEGAIRTTLLRTGKSIGTSALTTAAAFYTTLFVDFQGLRELGLIAGTGVMLCFLGMVTLLPAMLLLVDRRAERVGKLRLVSPVRVPFLEHLAALPVPALAVIVGLTLGGLFLVRVLPFNYNALDLHAEGVESVNYERLLAEQSDAGTAAAAFIVNTLGEVQETVERLKTSRNKGIVGQIESLQDFIPDGQDEKMAILAAGWEAVSDIVPAPPSSTVDPAILATSLNKLLDRVDELQDLLLLREDEESRSAVKELDALASRLESLSSLVEKNPHTVAVRLPDFQKRWFEELQTLLQKLQGALTVGPLTPDVLPPVLRNRFVSKDGSQFVVHAYPRKDIWVEENVKEFIAEMRDIDPRVTGVPVHFYESGMIMRDGFVRTAIYSLIAVFFLLLLDLRGLWKTLLAMVPLVIGLLWLLELVSLLGLSFNFANFFALLILIGCGIDGGVHIVHRFLETGSSKDVRKTTCTAVTLSFLTTMVGFGAMSFATHRGLASLGQMMFLGLFCLLVASVVLLPSFLALRERRRGPRKVESADRSGVNRAS